MKASFGPELAEKIGKRRDEGAKLHELSAEFGLSVKVVRRALLTTGREPKRKASYRQSRPERFTVDEERKIASEYAAGATLDVLAKQYGCSGPTISRAVQRSGGTVRPSSPVRWTPEFTARIAADYRSGESRESIAARLGVKPQQVMARLRTVGVVESISGENHWNWSGGRRVDVNGYIQVRPAADEVHLCRVLSNGYVLEHRLVMAKMLGRPLLPTETVHHINGQKDDNRVENLQLRQGYHGAGVVLQCRGCGSHDVEAVPIAS